MKCKCGHEKSIHVTAGCLARGTGERFYCRCSKFEPAKPRRKPKPFKRWTVNRDEESPMLEYVSSNGYQAIYFWVDTPQHDELLDWLARKLNAARVVLPKKARRA